jgi:hypothetical protein
VTADHDRVIVLSTEPGLRAALDRAAERFGLTLVHTASVPTARSEARSARLLIIAVEDAHWVRRPIACDGQTVLIGSVAVDRVRAADHAGRLGADLFLLRDPIHGALTELLRSAACAATLRNGPTGGGSAAASDSR